MDDTSSDTPVKLLALDWLGTMCNKIRIMERNLDKNEIVWFDGLKNVGQVHELWGIQKEFLQLCEVSEDRVREQSERIHIQFIFVYRFLEPVLFINGLINFSSLWRELNSSKFLRMLEVLWCYFPKSMLDF